MFDDGTKPRIRNVPTVGMWMKRATGSAERMASKSCIVTSVPVVVRLESTRSISSDGGLQLEVKNTHSDGVAS